MNIGYIGPGALGGELSRRFLPTHALSVWDLNPAASAPLGALGARVSPSAINSVLMPR